MQLRMQARACAGKQCVGRCSRAPAHTHQIRQGPARKEDGFELWGVGGVGIALTRTAAVSDVTITHPSCH